jgi:hypothetical protein
MPVFRYNTTGRWFKGNTHIHSTASDGGRTFADIAAMYAAQGYAFLFRTDHWVASDVAADSTAYPLLWLDGIELDGPALVSPGFCHVVCLGTVRNIPRERGFAAGLAEARRQGALLVLAHPHWSANTFDDTIAGAFDGVEVYNDVCRVMNGKGEGTIYWSAMLERRPETLGFAVDDAHLRTEHPGWNGGWIVVNAPACTREAIVAAIRRGNFYSSCGPEIHALEHRDGRVRITTSPARTIWLVGPAWQGIRAGAPTGPLVTQAEFTVPADWPYARLELEDECGRRAWTNPLFTAAA